MASKNLVYKVNGVPTQELIEKLDNNDNIFFRFQEPHQKLTSRSKSWGMIYSTEREAIADGCEILPGKSCMPTFAEILRWLDYYCKDYILLAFEGNDTGYTGHDGEYVATYYKKVAVWNFEDVKKYAEENLWK